MKEWDASSTLAPYVQPAVAHDLELSPCAIAQTLRLIIIFADTLPLGTSLKIPVQSLAMCIPRPIVNIRSYSKEAE